jgi:hypothetical protein
VAKTDRRTPAELREAVQRGYREAVANGTHSDARKHLCGKCDQCVDALFHRNLDGSMVCWDCAPQSERDAITAMREGRAA